MTEIVQIEEKKGTPQIPATGVEDPKLRPIIDAIRTTLNTRVFSKDNLDHWVTWRDLVSNDIVRLIIGNRVYTGSGGSNFVPAGGEDSDLDLTPPPAPTNVTATGALTTIIIEWDDPVYANFAYAEVWRSGQDNLGTAVKIGTTTATLYSDAVDTGSVYYYWVRFVSKANVTGPYQGTTGVRGETSQDPAFLLQILTGQITESQLFATLGARINLIDAPASVPNSVAARVQAEATARAQAILDEATARSTADSGLQTQITSLSSSTTTELQTLAAAIQNEATARTNADTAESAARETLAAQVRGSYTGTDVNALTTGLIYNERVARATQDSAIASSVSALSSTVTNNYNTLNSAITTEQTTRASADTALTTSISNLSATVSSNFTTLSANISSEEQARVSADSALSSSINTVSATANAKNRTYYQTSAPATGLVVGDIWFDTDDNRKAYRWDGSAWQATDDTRIAANAAAIVTEATARANGDSANAQSISQVQARLDTGDFAAVKTESSVTASTVSGIQAKYTVKIDNNGYVSGYGLISEANNSTPVSTFAVRADNFYVASPSGPAITPVVPFIVRTTSTTINGVSVPVGVYLTDGFIQNGTITNAKIGNAAIDDAKISSLSATKITAGSITTGSYIQSTNYVQGSSGWRIHGNGTAEFAAASIRGQLTAAQIDTRGLTIKDAAGNVLFGAGTPISTANISGLGSLATQNSVSAGDVDGLGSLATQNSVTTTQVTGLGTLATQNTVSTSQVTGLGTLATQNSVNWNTQLVNIPSFGGFAYLNTITSANISTYIQSAAIGNAYISDLNATKINAGTISADRIGANTITADKIDSRNLTIKDASGNVIFSSGVNLAANRVSGLGTLATANSVNWNTQLTNIPAFGNFAYLNSITSANISTYIAGAAIGEAYIANAAITNAKIADASISNAKIGNLQVDTLKIADNAVTVGSGASASNGLYFSDTQYNSVLSATLNLTGATIYVQGLVEVDIPSFSSEFESNRVVVYLIRNGVTLYGAETRVSTSVPISYLDTGFVGGTYEVWILSYGVQNIIKYRTLYLLGAKK